MDRDEFLEELFLLEPEALEAGLPDHLRAAAEADPELMAEVEALRRMDAALPQMGRLALDDNFFLRQRNQIVASVQAARARRVETRAWAAPQGSLVALFGVVGAYAFLGVEGGLLGTASAASEIALTGIFDPMNSFVAIYAALLVLALYVFHMDGRESRTSAVPVSSGGRA